MIELSKERIEQMLHEEAGKKEELVTILRGVYTRYMCMFEKYFADIDALNDDAIAGLREYHDETRSLVKYFYMDIPRDVCLGLREFEKKYIDKLLGSGWHEYLRDCYEDFKEYTCDEQLSEALMKAAFTKEALSDFYDVMDYIFRDDFGTESKHLKDIAGEISGFLFGKE